MARRRVLIAHRDPSVGESVALLLGLKGLSALYAPDLERARAIVDNFNPLALLFDTRLDAGRDYAFARLMRREPATTGMLLVAMSNLWPGDPIADLKAAGFDAHCRRPCALWQLADILATYFALVPGVA